ncbi:hypothetical protein Leryth_007741 [Lithospermum erythrorhizon]|nr:hypothetical protein Leryth_007741 [Lithospermum erythrorhizon]
MDLRKKRKWVDFVLILVLVLVIDGFNANVEEDFHIGEVMEPVKQLHDKLTDDVNIGGGSGA